MRTPDALEIHASRPRADSGQELAAVWKAADEIGGHFGTIVKLLILSGQRRGEIAALRPKFFDAAICTLPGSHH